MIDPVFIASAAGLLLAVVPLARALPAQNVAFIVLFLILVELAVEYWQGAQDLLVGAAFWPAAILWLRFGTQFILKSWRQNRNYGIFLLALPGIVTGAVQLAFSPALLMVGRFVLTAGCLAFLMPWFLPKRVTTSGGSKR
jgi:hypothetical protein